MRPQNLSFQSARSQPQEFKSAFLNSSMTEEQRLYEKLFGKNAAKIAEEEAEHAKKVAAENAMEDGNGVYLQISNLDQYYDESSLRSYLMNQMKPITPILSLIIETPSIAKVKVPSIQVRIFVNLFVCLKEYLSPRLKIVPWHFFVSFYKKKSVLIFFLFIGMYWLLLS